jgi:O-antigen ligase
MVKTSLIIFLVLLGFLGPQGPIIPVETFIIILLLAGSVLIFYVLCLFKWKFFERDLFKFTPLSMLFLLFLFWLALGYFYSADPERSILISIQSLSAILLYLGLSIYVQENNQVRTILKFALSFLGIIALVGIAQKFNFPILENSPTTEFFNKHTGNRYLSTPNHITSLFIHRNIFAGYLIFLIPIPCLIYISNWSKLWNLIAAVVLILSIIALALSGSRGGMLVGIIQLIVLIGYLLFNKDFKALIHLTLGVLICLILYITINKTVNTNCTGQWCENLSNLVSNMIYYPEQHQSLGRVLYWQGAWEIIKDHWLIGSGPLSFNLLFPKYYLYVTPFINNQIITSSPPHAHNIFIQTAADSGLIGISLMLAFLAVFYSRAYKIYANSIFKIRTAIFFITLAVTSFLLHSMIEYNWPGSMFIYNFTIFIFIINFIGRNQISARHPEKFSNSFYIVPIMGAGVITLTVIFSVQYYQFTNITSDKFSNINNLNELISSASQAKKICPRCDRPYIKLGSNMLFRYKENNDDKLLVLAKKELLEGQKLNPYNPHYMGFLAQIFAIQGDYSRAKILFKEALKFNRTHSIEKLGLSMEQLRKMDQAVSDKK